MFKNRYDGIDYTIVKQMRYHARTLMQHPCIYGMEIEDIEQELMLEVWSHTSRYDASKASFKTFIELVLTHKTADMIADAKAHKRGSGMRPASLDELLNFTEEERQLWPTCQMNIEHRLHLRVDFNRAINALSRELLILLLQLIDHNPSELAKKLNIPRGTLYERIFRLRAKLCVFDLKNR